MNAPAQAKRDVVVAGFMPLTDCAVLAAAREKGFAAAQDIDLVLVREASWANIRDRIAIGHFDVAHMLAPMVIAANLGFGPLRGRLIAPMALGRGGNAITVSQELYCVMQGEGAPGNGEPAATAQAFARAMKKPRQAASDRHRASLFLASLRAGDLAGERGHRYPQERRADRAAALLHARCAGGWADRRLLRWRALGLCGRSGRQGAYRHHQSLAMARRAGEGARRARKLRGEIAGPAGAAAAGVVAGCTVVRRARQSPRACEPSRGRGLSRRAGRGRRRIVVRSDAAECARQCRARRDVRFRARFLGFPLAQPCAVVPCADGAGAAARILCRRGGYCRRELPA